VATLALPILMLKREHPLIPPSLFRSRNFTVTNLSTLVIYGALYVTFFYLAVYVQGTLGYNPTAAGLMGIPGTLFLALFSSRFGRLAARYGPRLFMATGPALMGLGVLWYARIPASSAGWVFGTSAGKSLLPPADYFVDLLPGLILFGIGIMIMVAPLTTALMTSVPEHNSGVASAINNAISRVGPQLAGALIFVAIASSFYHGLSTRVPGLDTAKQTVREKIAPLNRPDSNMRFKLPSGRVVTGRELTRPAKEASTHSFHIAMVIGAMLLFAGAIINAVGIRNQPPVPASDRAGPETARSAGAPAAPEHPAQSPGSG
jgi:MFS family permease